MVDLPYSARPPWRRYLSEGVSGLRTMVDVAMLTVGSALVGLAAAVLLAGFGLVSSTLDLSTAALLGSALVTGIVGAFALGVASEGGVGRLSEAGGMAVERLVGRILPGLLVAVSLLAVHAYLRRFAGDLPVTFDYGIEVVRAAGVAGLIASILGPGLTWGLSMIWTDDLMVEVEIPILYLIWALALLVLYRVPAA